MKISQEILGPLGIRDFRLFIMGHFISFTGTWIQNTALHWLIYSLNHSTALLGLFTFITTFPGIIITLFSGFLIDRTERKKLLQILLFLSLFPPLMMWLLSKKGIINFWFFAILGLIGALFSSIDMPLRQVFISEIVPPSLLTRALSLQALSFNTARMFGPALAGLIIELFSLSLCFFVNFLSFLPLLLFTFLIKTQTKTFSTKTSQKFQHQIKDFLDYLKKHSYIFKGILITALFSFFAVPVNILLPMIAKEVLGGGAKEFAMLSTALGLGAIFGALSVFLRREMKSKMRQFLLAHLLWGLGVIGFIHFQSLPMLFLSTLLIGSSYTNFYPVMNSFLQERTPLQIRGKVMSLFSVAFLGMAPLGQFFIGLATEWLSYRLWLIFILVLLFLVNLKLIFSLEKISN